MNLSIVISCLAVVLLAPRVVAAAGSWVGRWPTGLLAFGTTSLAVGTLFINLNLASQLPYSKVKAPAWAQPRMVLVSIVLPLVLAGLSVGFWLTSQGNLAAVFLSLEPRTLLIDAGILGGVTAVIALLWLGALKIVGVERKPGDRPTWKWRLLGLVVGVAIGLVGLVSIQEIFAAPADNFLDRIWVATVWGLPSLLSVFGVATIFVVGTSGRQFEEDSREWWSRLGGVLLGIAVAWVLVAAAAIYAPYGVIRLKGVIETLGIAWLVTTIAGVRAASSGLTGKPGSTRWLDLLAKITPYVFVAGLLVALAYAIHAVLAWANERPVALAADFVTDWDVYAKEITPWLSNPAQWALLLAVIVAALFLSWRIDVNLFSFHMFYRNRLVRCYLGASNPKRTPHPFTGFDGDDSLALKSLLQRPYHLINTAMNITKGSRIAWQERKAAPFVGSPLFCGYEFREDDGKPTSAYQRTDEFLAEENRRWHRRIETTPSPGDAREGARWHAGDLSLGLGTAFAVSGAAASPNQGYHSSPPVAFLLTVFNVRLGWWLQNPARPEVWRREGPRWGIRYLLSELVGMVDDRSKYVYVSDGGHFENLGIYELVRRRCRFIVACDAGMDPSFEFEDLGNAIRKCKVDLGIPIEINTQGILPDAVGKRGQVHCAVGTIRYDRKDPDLSAGYLLYIKPSLTGSEPLDVLQYAVAHPEFPHETTTDQWFGESQFESYRKLGYHIAKVVFEGAGIHRPGKRENMFVALKERWYPSSAAVKTAFSRRGDHLKTLQESLRSDPNLRFLDAQIYPEWDRLMAGRREAYPTNQSLPSTATEVRAGFYFCNNLLELMESVYLDLNLEEEHGHPDNRGWMNLFRNWSWSTMFRVTYAICSATYGARFQTFCERRLDLSQSKEVIVHCNAVETPPEEFLAREEERNRLNFVEIDIIRKLAQGKDRVPFDELLVFSLLVRDPSRPQNGGGASALEFPFGFALTSRREFVYFRVQDHLRRMGLAREGLKKLAVLGYESISEQMDIAVERVTPRRPGVQTDAESPRRFRMLLSSVLREL